MRVKLITIAILALLHGFAQTTVMAVARAQDSVASEFTITIAAPANPIHLGATIEIGITVKNVSGTTAYWRSESGDTAYRGFHFLLKKDGEECERSEFHRYLRNEQRANDRPKVTGGSSIVSEVPPGRSFGFTVDLKRLYEITGPGIYTLSISRFDEFAKTTSQSNTVTLNVLQ